jgi:phosphoenolpyruvate phosphomutase
MNDAAPVDIAVAKRSRLREAMEGRTPVVTVGAHDALTARLIEHYGFDAVWVSGFGVATMGHALPDINVVTMTEALDAAMRMNRATTLPVIADCDNGYGGLTNVVRTVQEYESRGIAGICVEDNVFPKRNSLYQGAARRELVPVTEQCRRLSAGKRAQQSDAFFLIARVESFIAGHGLEDALERAQAYADAGADAVLIHSKDRSLAEIEDFLARWDDRVPLVAVPTLFPNWTADELHLKGFQMIILANQPMRAAVQATEQTLQVLRREARSADVDQTIAPVERLFELVDTKRWIAMEDASM